MTVSTIQAFIGSPGSGKTHSLTRMVNELLEKGESVYIMNPTRSARNNVRKAFKEMMESGEMEYNNYVRAFKSTNVLHGFHDSPSKNIFIDESAMIDLSSFYSLLYETIRMDDVHIYLFGDMKQIQPIFGDSILKTVIEKTMDKNESRNIWQYVTDTLYSHMNNSVIDAPDSWKLDCKVNITVFKQNYRLESKSFSGYDDDYYDYLIDNTVFTDDYSGYLKYAIENNWLITTPTKARGNEINDILSKVYDDVKLVAPFIVDGNGDYYLNPFNDRCNELEQAFDFMPEIDIESLQSYTLTSYMSTHRVQSFTVDNVLFYLGNNPIANRHKSHYSNNMLYTAVSRSRFNAQLLGNPDSFKQMRITMPQTAQEKSVHLKAGLAIENLKNWIEESDSMPTADGLYDKYVELYENDLLIPDFEQSVLDIYKIQSKIYSKRYVISHINDKYNAKFGYTLTQWLKDNKSNSQKGNTNRTGKGKVQQWIETLSDDEIDEVKGDIEELSVRKFKAKYNYTKSTVEKLV